MDYEKNLIMLGWPRSHCLPAQSTVSPFAFFSVNATLWCVGVSLNVGYSIVARPASKGEYQKTARRLIGQLIPDFKK